MFSCSAVSVLLVGGAAAAIPQAGPSMGEQWRGLGANYTTHGCSSAEGKGNRSLAEVG